ncbi:DUF4233 domain-containing protein [Microcella sp.]|uniref:DUF4233 domain-containing protein n=1 Tax=Microcella sp. TaxID=1913979 RepID=UPI00391C972E
MTETADAAPRRPKREKTATESLMTATMGMEIVVVLFGAIALFGIRVTDPPALAFLGGVVLIVLLAIGIRLARYSWGYWYSGALQVLLLATGFVEPLAAVTAAIFVGYWIYSLVRGRQLDEAKRRHLAEHPTDQEN